MNSFCPNKSQTHLMQEKMVQKLAQWDLQIPNVGLVISSGVQRRVSTDVRTGATVNALQTLSKAQLLQQLLVGQVEQIVECI